MRRSARRLFYTSLAFTSATVVWILCVAAPILIGIAFVIVPVVLFAVWARLASQQPVSELIIEGVTVGTLVLATGLLMPPVSKAILRLSLRLSPLPMGSPARANVPPLLWVSWLSVVAVLVLAGSEWVTVFVAIAVGVCGFARVYRFRRGWQGLPSGQTVLFLRRFGRTADRLVSTAIRRALPRSASLVFLVGPRQGAVSWDPLVVAFDGLPNGVPMYVQSTDDQWVSHVKRLVVQTGAIVLDATDWSDAIETELAIVQACGASGRLTILVREGAAGEPTEQPGLLRYRASWRDAGHRIFWGFLMTLLPGVVAEDLGARRATLVVVTIAAVVAWLLLVVRPLMDETAAEALAHRLRAA